MQRVAVRFHGLPPPARGVWVLGIGLSFFLQPAMGEDRSPELIRQFAQQQRRAQPALNRICTVTRPRNGCRRARSSGAGPRTRPKPSSRETAVLH
jgi:hypothetical protein